jgi:hypothetical protein
MMQKNILGALVLGSSLAVFAGGVSAAELKLTHQATGGFNGGPFLVSDMTDVGGAGALTGQSDFITFCVEKEETVSGATAGATYQYSLSNKIEERNSLLKAETAFLYSSFRSGALDSSVDFSFQSSSAANLISLQKAIWDIEYGTTTAGVLETALVAFATSLDGGAWSGLGNVRVVNLTSQSGTVSNQSQLAVVPIPAAAWLFGSALLGFAGISRKRSSSQK